MRAVSLFSGVGGFEFGFEHAGIETILQAESDPWCLNVLERHWPDVERLDDVRKVDEAARFRRSRDVARGGRRTDAEPERHANGTSCVTSGVDCRDGAISSATGEQFAGGIDLVYGGFPCQDLSVAGKRAGLRGQRSGLWHEFERVLRDLRPRWVIVENVPGLLSSNGGADFGVLLRGLGELGYGWAYRVLDARWFGVPQRRRRVFVVGCLGDAPRAAQVLAVCESCGGHPQARGEAREDVAPTLVGGSDNPRSRGKHNGSDELPMIVGSTVEEDSARPLLSRASGYRGDMESETFVVASSLEASAGHHGYRGDRGDNSSNLIAWDDRNQAALDGTHHTLRGAGLQRSDVIAFREDYDGHREVDQTGAMTSEGFRPQKNSATINLVSHVGVRRLTPLECERLMGWPDDWTRWTADGKEVPDSHRYRMIGNGVVATVAEWIGHRLVAVDRRRGQWTVRGC
jgi:DNA (cytosine-5)-methyltransferase 1